MKLYNIPQPFAKLGSAEITMADGTTRIGKYAVFDNHGIGSVQIYESDDCNAHPTDIFYLCDSAVESIRWFETDADKIDEICDAFVEKNRTEMIKNTDLGTHYLPPIVLDDYVKEPKWKYEPTDAKCSEPAFSGC